MTSSIAIQGRFFYLFLGFHSFLLGLFPFFLPVFLYKTGHGVDQIAQLIGFTGVGFCLALRLWDTTRASGCRAAVLLSFVLEGVLLLLIVWDAPIVLLGIVNGWYSCLYWTIQRVYFFSGGNSENSGRRFGNLQIFVLVILKAGVLCGSLALDYLGVWYIVALSVLTAVPAALLFSRTALGVEYPARLLEQPPLSLHAVRSFHDSYRSKQVFVFDGIFLYLESYFWLISLFLLVRESYSRLGILVIVLAVVLALIFYMVKNRIDRVSRQKLYFAAVFLYGISWLMRAHLSDVSGHSLQLGLLLLIAFCTSFFRLAFNKRFFDIAEKKEGFSYLLVKSYYSQLFLALFFLLFSLVIPHLGLSTGELLDYTYLGAALASGFYLLFRMPTSHLND